MKRVSRKVHKKEVGAGSYQPRIMI